jgi:hypothetical protein
MLRWACSGVADTGVVSIAIDIIVLVQRDVVSLSDTEYLPYGKGAADAKRAYCTLLRIREGKDAEIVLFRLA